MYKHTAFLRLNTLVIRIIRTDISNNKLTKFAPFKDKQWSQYVQELAFSQVGLETKRSLHVKTILLM